MICWYLVLEGGVDECRASELEATSLSKVP